MNRTSDETAPNAASEPATNPDSRPVTNRTAETGTTETGTTETRTAETRTAETRATTRLVATGRAATRTVGTASRRDRPGGRTTAWLLTAVLCAALGLTTGCGTDTADGSIPAGWSTLRTKALSVSYPPAFAPQGGKTRSRYNAATAALSEGGKDIAVITVQIGFTNADSVEEAAIGAEAGIALGSTLGKQQEIQVAGPEDHRQARRIDFEFTDQGSRIKGVIVAGLDSTDTSYAVRVDSARGKVSDGDLNRIISSITVK